MPQETDQLLQQTITRLKVPLAVVHLDVVSLVPHQVTDAAPAQVAHPSKRTRRHTRAALVLPFELRCCAPGFRDPARVPGSSQFDLNPGPTPITGYRTLGAENKRG